MKESNIMTLVMMRATRLGARLFRNTVGIAYQGAATRVSTPRSVMMYPGDVLVRGARTITFGLGTDSSDCIGFTPIIITQEMVGCQISVFTAAEVKTDIGQPTEGQLKYIEFIKEFGGIAGIVRSEQDLEDLILPWNPSK